ncbi:protein of unknown function [Thauera humireducens]|nr:protein of unknown function [Thauera humireducens]
MGLERPEAGSAFSSKPLMLPCQAKAHLDAQWASCLVRAASAELGGRKLDVFGHPSGRPDRGCFQGQPRRDLDLAGAN